MSLFDVNLIILMTTKKLLENYKEWNCCILASAREKKSKKKDNEATEEFEDGTWRAFVDECPHRKVPLSEGRIENDGTLFCSYHGWRFDGDGSCTHVPQVTSDEKMDVILSNPKSSCNAFPTKVINGLLFVWPSNDKDAILESELTPVAHVPEEKEGIWCGPWNYRELPYGHDYFQENVVDPGKCNLLD